MIEEHTYEYLDEKYEKMKTTEGASGAFDYGILYETPQDAFNQSEGALNKDEIFLSVHFDNKLYDSRSGSSIPAAVPQDYEEAVISPNSTMSASRGKGSNGADQQSLRVPSDYMEPVTSPSPTAGGDWYTIMDHPEVSCSGELDTLTRESSIYEIPINENENYAVPWKSQKT